MRQVVDLELDPVRTAHEIGERSLDLLRAGEDDAVEAMLRCEAPQVQRAGIGQDRQVGRAGRVRIADRAHELHAVLRMGAQLAREERDRGGVTDDHHPLGTQQPAQRTARGDAQHGH